MKEFVFETELEKNPSPHRTPTITRWGTYKGKNELFYIKDLGDKLNSFLSKEEDLPIFDEKPVEISYVFGFMPAKSWTKKKKTEAFDGKWMYRKPDISNIIKSTDDIVMGSKVIGDDQYIVKYGDVEKIYTEKPYIKIKVKEIE